MERLWRSHSWLPRRDFRFADPCRASRRSGHSIHGLITSMPQPWKSAVFRVATAARCDRAIAAIMASNCDIGRPARSRAATILANPRAASSSKGSIRPANSSSNIFSTADSNRRRRLPGGSVSTPYRTSASVIVVVNTDKGCWAASQPRTVWEGRGLRASESTFVSRSITWRASGDDGQLHEAGRRVPHRQEVRYAAGSIPRD